MKSGTRKYVRILDAQIKISQEINKLYCYGEDWRKQNDKKEKLEKKHFDLETKLKSLETTITQEEFEEHLSDRMCCTWEDFKGVE